MMSIGVEVLPPEVLRYVRRFEKRRRRLALLKAVGAALAFVLLWVLLWCTADRLLAFPPAVRLTLLLIGAQVISEYERIDKPEEPAPSNPLAVVDGPVEEGARPQ